jgi:hypothetical protein
MLRDIHDVPFARERITEAPMQNPGWYQWLLMHLPILEFLTLFSIAVGLFCHVVESYRSRKSAQTRFDEANSRIEETYKQTRLALEQSALSRAQHVASQKPILVLLIDQAAASMGKDKLGLQRISLKNIGLGPAFNIRVRSFQYQDYRLEFDPLDFIEKEKSRALGFVASAGGEYSGLARSLILLETALLSEQNAVVSEIPVEYSYDDTFGNRYRANAEMMVDHMSGKIGVTYSNICSPSADS